MAKDQRHGFAGESTGRDPPTHKWDSKTIQVNAQCFYADTDEYRCAVLSPKGLPGGLSGTVRIDFDKISPPEIFSCMRRVSELQETVDPK